MRKGTLMERDAAMHTANLWVRHRVLQQVLNGAGPDSRRTHCIVVMRQQLEVFAFIGGKLRHPFGVVSGNIGSANGAPGCLRGMASR